MVRREKEILLTLSAIGAAGLLVFFMNGASEGVSTRARRGAEVMDMDDDFFDQEFHFDDVNMFQNVNCDAQPNHPDCLARKKGKGNKGKGKAPSYDFTGFWASEAAQDIMNEANSKANAALSKYHVKNAFTDLAAVSPDVTVRGFDSIELSGPTMDAFANNMDAGDNSCGLNEPNRVTDATQSVFFVVPKDIMFDSAVNQDDLLASYKNFGVNLANNIGDGTRVVFGSYASTGKIQTQEVGDDASATFDNLLTSFEVQGKMSKGNPSMRVAQVKARSLFGVFTAPGIKNKFFRRSDAGTGSQTCQAFFVFHGLPTDYKDFASGEFDMDRFNQKCNIVPIFVQQNGLEDFYANWAATFRASNSMFSAAETAFRGYVLTNPSDIAANSANMANQLTSYACACEQRSACLIGKPAYIEAIEDPALLTTAGTTTEGTTTSAYSTTVTTTTEFTTTADFRGVGDLTEEIPADNRCCGLSGDLGAAKYDQNRQFCCNDGEAFYVSSEVC